MTDYEETKKMCSKVEKLVIEYLNIPPWELDRTDVEGMLSTLKEFALYIKDNSLYHLG